MFKVTDVINASTRDYQARFSFYRGGKLYYVVHEAGSGRPLWEFPVDVTNTRDIGDATFGREFKAITLMRYIRKAIESDSLVKMP